MAHPNAHPVIAVQGGATVAPTLLGQGPARIPTGGKIRAGIKVLTKKAAGEPKAKAIYEQGVAAGQSTALQVDGLRCKAQRIAKGQPLHGKGVMQLQRRQILRKQLWF